VNRITAICIFAIVLAVGIQNGFAGTGTDDRLFGLPDGQRINEDVQLVLKIPYEIVLYDEAQHIYLGVKNRSGETLRLQWGGDDWEQLLFQARSEPDGENLTEPKFTPEWSRVGNIIDEYMDHFEIKQNESRIYMRHRGGLKANYDRLPPGTREIRVGLLTGPEEWAFSDWVPIRRLNDRRLVDAEIVYEFPYHSFTVAVRRMLIENDEYLFLEWCRLAKLPEGSTPRLEFYREERTQRPILKTYFDGVDVPPQLTDVGSILEIEWTPEIAPHATMLEELRAEMRGNPEASDEDDRTDSDERPAADEVQPEPEAVEAPASPAQPPQSPEHVAPDPADASSPSRLIWPLLLLLLIIACCTTLLVLRHKTKKPR